MLLNTAFEEFINARHRTPATRVKYRSRLRLLLARYGEKEANAITPAMLFDLFDGWGELSTATLAARRSSISALFAYCVSRGWCPSNPVANVRRYSDRPTVINIPQQKDVEAVLALCRLWSASGDAQKVRDAAIITLAANSGKRRGEVQNLRLDAVKNALARPVGAGVYALPTSGKTGPAQLICDEGGAGMLRRWIELRPAVKHGYLWVVLRPGAQWGEPITERVMERARQRVCQAANVPLITYQELRRLKATLVGRQFGLHVAAEVLGHSSGTSVVKHFYYNPDAELAYRAVVETAL